MMAKKLMLVRRIDRLSREELRALWHELYYRIRDYQLHLEGLLERQLAVEALEEERGHD